MPYYFTVSPSNLIGDLYYANLEFFVKSNDENQKITALTSGNIVCSYRITNDSKSNKKVTVITGLFEDGALQTIVSKTYNMQSTQSCTFNNEIVVPDDYQKYEIQVFVLEDIDAGIPLVKVGVLNTKSSEKEVIYFSLQGRDGTIDSYSKKIEVSVPYATPLKNVNPKIVVSDKAKYDLSSNDFSEPVAINITAEDGSRQKYMIYTYVDLPPSAVVYETFENSEFNTLPSGWRATGLSSGTVSVVQDPKNPENKVLKVDDTGALNVQAILDFDPIYPPFEATFKVMYGHNDSYSSGNNDASYSSAAVGSDANAAKSIGAVSINQSSSNIRWVYRTQTATGEQGELTVSGTSAHLDEWYNVKLIYRTDKMVEYYIDDKLLTIAQPRSAEDYASSFWFTSSLARKSYAYIDDISIVHLESAEIEKGYFQDFNDLTVGSPPPEEWQTSATSNIQPLNEDNYALCIYDGDASLHITPINESVKLSFDIVLDDNMAAPLDFGEIVGEIAVINNDETVTELLITHLGNSKFGITKDTNTQCMIYDNLLLGVQNNIKIICYYNENFEKSIADIYINESLAANLIIDSIGADSIRFKSQHGFSIWLDNVQFKPFDGKI